MTTTPSIVLLPNVVIRSEERLYTPLLGLAMLLDSTIATIALAYNQPFPPNAQRQVRMSPRQHPFDVVFDTSSVVKSLFDQLYPREIKFWGAHKSSSSPSAKPSKVHKIITIVRVDVAASIFVKHYETYKDDILGRLPTDPDERPAVFRFAQTVRNAISHRGKVSWPKNEGSKPPVTWSGFTISREMHGELLIGPLLNEADLIWLLLEFDGLLHASGVPHPDAHLVKYITK
jgi:hypothetical protein